MQTGIYNCLELFAKSENGKNGSVELSGKNGNVMTAKAGKTYFTWLKFPVEQNTEYEIKARNCEISLCYLSGCENVMEQGVRFLELDKRTDTFIQVEENVQYDTPIREQFHFAPWKNWMNDPNGLCWYHGYYHMFYQFNPHWQEWSNMYWGHAVSKDLVHWTHLPVVLEPQKEIMEYPEKVKGGAFSGCAVPLDNQVVFYLTRHYGPMEDCPETVQQQWMMKSTDMIHFSEEKLLIAQPPKGASFHFRDPKVLKIGNHWYMVLASAVGEKAAILLYRSEDMENWRYLHPLIVEETEGICCFECPDFMELDGVYVAMGAWMCHYDEGGRYQMSRYYIGDFENEKFEVHTSGWYDFGSNCYAMQSFEHKGRRICIGWISDFYGEHIEAENGAYGSMTIPRELHVKDGRLFETPVKEIEQLRGARIYQGRGESISLERIPGNTYTAKLRFKGQTDFELMLGKDGEKEIFLCNGKEGLFIKTKGVKSQNVTFRADVEYVHGLEIFVDRRVVEIYVNQGEAVGTKLFYNTSGNGCFILRCEKENNIEEAEIYLMNTIWKK